MERQNDFEVTEDFTELLEDKKEVTERLDVLREDPTEEFIGLYSSEPKDIPNPQEEVHINDFDDDFSDLVRRRDYKGKVEINNNGKHSKKRKLKKWVYALILLVLLGGGFAAYKIVDKKNTEKRLAEEKKILDYYISFEDVEEGEEQEIDNRYKNYLPFNINIVTKDKFTMYLDKEKYLTINESMEFPVIINNYENKYYVEYNNRLVNISKDDVEKTKENKNTDKKNQAKMTTLAYHRVYEETDKCTDPYVCLKKSVFDKQMKYLSDNKYFTLTMDEMYMYMKGYLQIEKGVVITIDDGLLFKAADEVLDKYGLRGTLFIATGAYTNYAQFDGLKAIENQSHTHNMHKNYVCAGGNQGGAILCAGKQKIIEDLKKSIEILKTEPKALAFPFYDYNDTAIQAVKEVGFKMAFIGRAGVMGRATPKVTDMYKIPRMTVWEESLMSYNSWKSYL